jgi:hypothetical protein
LLGQFHRHYLAVNNDHFSDLVFCGWKVYQGLQYIKDFQQNLGAVICDNGVSMYEEKYKKKMFTQDLSMRMGPDASPRPQMTTLSMQVTWFC